MEPNLVDTTRLTTSHPSGDTLENYALGLLSETEQARVETHLFVCYACQDALAETDNYVAAMKAALAEPEASPAPGRWAAFVDSLRFSGPVPAFGAALAALSLAAILVQTYTPSLAATEAEITLRSLRGGAEIVDADGPANASLALKIQSHQLQADESYSVKIVDAAGNPAWTGRPSANILHVDKALSAGTYWVRLYSPQKNLVQEYGLKLH